MIIISGPALLSLITASVASILVERKIKEGKGLETITDKDHIIICGWNENGVTCPEDCPPEIDFCGNGTCGPDEDCASCDLDCGECWSTCGDLNCGPNEHCGTCPADCGVCPAVCGDDLCEGSETCASCERDCGAC